MHIRESIHVDAVVDLTPGTANLLQAVRAKRCKRKHTAFSQYSGNLRKDGAGIIKPRQKQIREDDIDASVRQRKRAGIGTTGGEPLWARTVARPRPVLPAVASPVPNRYAAHDSCPTTARAFVSGCRDAVLAGGP